MYTKKIMDSMHKCKECLYSMDEYRVLAKAISVLADEAELFEKYIGKDCPSCDHYFKNHFKEFLKMPFDCITADDCVTLYEDVVMLIREKQLRLGLASLGGDEVDLLKDFETRITDKNCLAYQWYYEKLPLKIVKEVSEAIVHKY